MFKNYFVGKQIQQHGLCYHNNIIRYIKMMCNTGNHYPLMQEQLMCAFM